MNSPVELDGADLRLLEALRQDPRATNTLLAARLSITEVAVANRIRLLEARGIMRVVAQLSFRALGYNVLALVDVEASSGRVKELANALASLEGVGSASIMLGHPSIILQVQADDLHALERLLLDEISAVDGVEGVESNVIIDIEKWTSGSAQLDLGQLTDAHRMLMDGMDRLIIAELQKNGRSSNREVARVLGVSEATIRQRLKKLDTAKIMRLGLVVDTQALGRTAAAFVRMKLHPRRARLIASAVRNLECCDFVGLTVGRFDLIALLVAESREALAQSLDEVAALEGVALLEVREPVGYAKHRYDLIHIP